METRNFYILIASILIGVTTFWLFLIAIIELDIDLFQDPKKIEIKGNGVNREITLSLSDLKSDQYLQIEDKVYHIMNSVGSEYDVTYSGVSLWSVLEIEGILSDDPSVLTFQFFARDGYRSPKPLNLSIVQLNPELVIIAYEKNGDPLFEDGPLRSVMDQSIMPSGEYSSQYSVQMLKEIVIN
ncbi:MAG: hypothetical protein ACFE8L_07600 [Candidatus Hodarchaeota archaeon]